MLIHKYCSLFGHKNTPCDENIINSLRFHIENLILDCGVTHFLFGTKSDFYESCHKVICKLKQKYPHIKTVCYLCSHESCFLSGDSPKLIERYETTFHKSPLVFDGKREIPTTGKSAYILRNRTMIDDSSYCIFYFDERILKSGTRIAYDYATTRKKRIINIAKPPR